jgi:hypothetical protein
MGPKSDNVETLEPAVYRVTREDDCDSLYLVKTSVEFELPTKIFNMDADFIKRVTT